jgi:hypothetical protein
MSTRTRSTIQPVPRRSSKLTEEPKRTVKRIVKLDETSAPKPKPKEVTKRREPVTKKKISYEIELEEVLEDDGLTEEQRRLVNRVKRIESTKRNATKIAATSTGNNQLMDQYKRQTCATGKRSLRSSTIIQRPPSRPSRTNSRNKSKPQNEVLRSAKIEGLGDEYLELYDTIGMAFHSYATNKDGYEIGGTNEIYKSRRERASRIKSAVPAKIPEVKFKPGPIDCPFEYHEMLKYYDDKQIDLTSKNSQLNLIERVKKLQELELKFIYTYPRPPKPEDFNCMSKYKTEASEWLNNEELRLDTGLCPSCSKSASDIIEPIELDPEWVENHRKLIKEFEIEFKNNTTHRPRDRVLLDGLF